MLRCRKELTTQFEHKKRPDIAIYKYKDGKKMLLDITITHPFAVKNLSGNSEKAAFARKSRRKQSTPRKLKLSDISSDLHVAIELWSLGPRCGGYFVQGLFVDTSNPRHNFCMVFWLLVASKSQYFASLEIGR